jgi:hypothetical protein
MTKLCNSAELSADFPGLDDSKGFFHEFEVWHCGLAQRW